MDNSNKSPNSSNFSYNSDTEATIFKLGGAFIVGVLLFVGGIITGRAVSEDFLNFDNFFNSSDSQVRISGDTSGDLSEIDFDLYWDVWNVISRRYVDDTVIKEESMFYESIRGMVESLGDPHTIYLDPEETRTFNEGSAGNFFSGIGAELGYENGNIVVIAPLKGSPAMESGIRAGDVILAIDGEEVAVDESIFDAVFKIRGEKGTDVVLTVQHRNESEPVDITITRDEITVPSMEYEYNSQNDIAIVEVTRFTESSLDAWNDKWDSMVDKVVDSGADKMILDLRGNPGGYLDAAVYAASEFLPEDTVVVQQEDREGHVYDYAVSREGRLLDIEVIVLVNEASASASEILAGALQKNDSRATVIGVDTFGKGTAQEVVDFTDGSSLHVTVIKWLLPDGTWLNKDNKIEPDIEVQLTDEDFKEGKDPQLEKAISELN